MQIIVKTIIFILTEIYTLGHHTRKEGKRGGKEGERKRGEKGREGKERGKEGGRKTYIKNLGLKCFVNNYFCWYF